MTPMCSQRALHPDVAGSEQACGQDVDRQMRPCEGILGLGAASLEESYRPILGDVRLSFQAPNEDYHIREAYHKRRKSAIFDIRAPSFGSGSVLRAMEDTFTGRTLTHFHVAVAIQSC